jgi:hypothetical protein
MAAQNDAPYPVRYWVDYPEDGRVSRVTTAFRAIWILPILLLSWVAGGVTILAPLAMLLFRHKYPRWWFDWNLELLRFTSRVTAYQYLLTDRYPSTDEEQTAHLVIDYPDVAQELGRWKPLVKWLLAIPHYVVLMVLGLVATLAVIVAWFAILVTGSYPRGIFRFVVGVQRWKLRVLAYAFLLVTDRYPPFTTKPVGGQAAPAA